MARYFRPNVSAREVLAAVRPSVDYGVGRGALRAALRELGVEVEYRKDLTTADLRRCVKQDIPVIVSIWPDDWLNDHWVVAQGFAAGRVYLANHRSLPVRAFRRLWSDFDVRGRGGSGEGFVCSPVAGGVRQHP